MKIDKCINEFVAIAFESNRVNNDGTLNVE